MQSKVAFFLIIIKTTCPALREGHTVKLCLPGFLQHQTRNTGAEAIFKIKLQCLFTASLCLCICIYPYVFVYVPGTSIVVFVFVSLSLRLCVLHPCTWTSQWMPHCCLCICHLYLRLCLCIIQCVCTWTSQWKPHC